MFFRKIQRVRPFTTRYANTLKASSILQSRLLRAFSVSQNLKNNPNFPNLEDTEDPIAKVLIEKSIKPLAEEISDFNKKYPRRPLNLTVDLPVDIVYKKGKDEPKRASLTRVKQVLATPIVLYSIYVFMNESLYDIPSKVILAAGIAGNSLYYKFLLGLRQKEIQELFLEPDYGVFYLTLISNQDNDLLFNVPADDKIHKLRANLGLPELGEGLGVVKVPLEKVLFLGHSKVRKLMQHHKYSFKEAREYIEEGENVNRDLQRGVLLGTLMEFFGLNNKEDADFVFYSDELGDFVSLEIISKLNELDELDDYVENVCNRRSTHFLLSTKNEGRGDEDGREGD